MPSLVILQIESGSTLLSRITELGRDAGEGAKYVALAAAVMLLGWGAAAIVSRIVRGVLHAMRFDAAVRRVLGPGLTGGHEPAAVAGWAAYWLVLASVAMLALEVIGFNLAASVASRLEDVVPRIVTSTVLFTVGTLIAVLVGSVTRRFLESAEVRAATLLGQIVTAVLLGFTALLALEQLGFAAQFVMAVGVVAVGAAGLGLALAFGLGCRELARDFVVEYLRSLDQEGPKPRPSEPGRQGER